jgi:predicted dehydrogenase
VRENKIVLQTGTQQRSSQRFRLACELVRNERIGKLKEANVWIPAGRREGPFSPEPPPPELNWDFWQGQAPATDYIKERCHQRFRFWYEYSGGIMTDWGAHHNDIAYWAVGIVAPRDVEATSHIDPIPGGFTTHSDFTVRYTYENGVALTVRTTPDDNPSGGVINKEGQRNGIRFEGEEGWIWINRDRISACDSTILRTPLPEGSVRLYESPNHMKNFFDCVRSRKDPICTAEIGHRSATMCHLGAIALRTGFKLKWDGERERFVGAHADVANRYLKREMRKPYDYGFVA